MNTAPAGDASGYMESGAYGASNSGRHLDVCVLHAACVAPRPKTSRTK